MTSGDRTALTVFANAAEKAGEWRSGMVEHSQSIGLEEFVATRTQLQETLASAYVQGLFAVNDARVLLNIYTVMLLLVLGNFGVRLGRSHRELNESPDELEHRVRERTRDLELAIIDLTESQVRPHAFWEKTSPAQPENCCRECTGRCRAVEGQW